ncbi:MAG TPA: hypothetical protein PK509_09395 [Catalimonadaceae bacterium]|nr:hypothetical protein [Catalimonadaceae bacterium]
MRNLLIIGLLIGICLFRMGETMAQSGTKIRKKIPRPTSDFQLDSLTIIAPTLRCISDTSLRFAYDFKTGRIQTQKGTFLGDSVTFEYYRYPFDASKPVYAFSTALYDSLLSFADYPGLERKPEKREELFEMPGIQKSGVISRGISVGNGQNGFVNSALNLQLEGQLSPEIRLTAVLSDQSVPFQPQGNTQQIRELDKIYIQLDHKQGRLLAGDVVLKNEESQFLRYYKNIQGAQVEAYWDSTKQSKTRVGAGVAKGKFASVVVTVTEGVHGPYRLRPPNNPDLLVVILANSERIYFDNRLLKRGFNQDYVIDYNTGELTLNNNLLVTQFTRLRCDFEYSERNYSRTIVMGEHEEKIGQATIQLTHYQEQDNASRPLSFSLDSLSSSILNQAGDDPRKAVLPGAQTVTSAQEGQLYYVKMDTLVGTELVSVFQAATNQTSGLWQVTFSDVGEGNGDYRLLQNLGNGKLYIYNGPGGGSYLPVRQAVLPNRRAMSRAAVSVNLGKGHAIRTEAAFSQYDRNRLSKLDKADNGGNAQSMGYSWNPDGVKGKILPSASVEYIRLSRNFQAIDRFRGIEFERDWNGNSGDTLSADDHLVQSRLGLKKDDQWDVFYSGAWRNKGGNVKGLQQQAGLNFRLGLLRFQNQAFLMQNSRSQEEANWRRLSSMVSMDKYGLIPAYTFTADENVIRRSRSDSVLRTVMNYRAHSFSLKSKDSSQQVLSVSYTYREDQQPFFGELFRNLFSQNGELRAGKTLAASHRIDLYGNYRTVRYARLEKQEENLAGRLDYQGSFWDGALRQEIVFTANTGQEAKRNFQFIRVNAVGEGTHQWVDYNGNGLQELDEFVEAQRTEDRQYIKIFTPTSELIRAYTNVLNYRLNLAAPQSWRFAGGIKKQLSKFSLLSSITSDQKSIGGKTRDRYLPFTDVGNEQVLSANRIFRNTVFFNRTQSDFGAEYSQINSLQKVLLSNGFSLRKIREHRFLFRKNLSTYLNFTLQSALYERTVQSDALAAQNYRLNGYEVGPEFSIQPNQSHRITGTGQYSAKQNQTGEEQTRLWKVGVEYRYNQQSSRTLNGSFRVTEIRHQGSLQSPAAYEMLEGLLPGRNLTWGINVQQKLAQGLQLLFTYEGRKSETIRVIHIGKMQANLLF